MKISLRWLRELVDTDLDGAAIAKLLTMAGLEVESRTVFGGFSGVIVAEVRGKKPHPNSNKLTLVDVWDGREVTQVVCGAPNVPEPNGERGAQARLVLWARPGATLPNGMTLAPKEVRGVMSPGMLCAEDELGFGEGHDGILIFSGDEELRPGDDVASKLNLPDEILEVNVTPNRADCLGHVGIARDLAALLGKKLKVSPHPNDTAQTGAAKVVIEDAEGCPHYSAQIIEGMQVLPSPLMLRLRLQSLGVRPISNVVDATNLAWLELGQPVHAFDYDKLAGQMIVVRRAKAGETIETLDKQTRVLTDEDLVIADRDKPVAIAGVMGGASSEVTAQTRRVLLEVAYFNPARVRRTSARLGLHTEASHRFERGCDPNIVAHVSDVTTPRIGRPAGMRTDVYPKKISPRTIALRPARTESLLGCEIPTARQREWLSRIGLTVSGSSDKLDVTVPTYRPDLEREIDLIEEIARLEGYEKIPVTVPRLQVVPEPMESSTSERVRDLCAGLGLDEIVTYGFVSPKQIAALGFPNDTPEARPIRIANPIREEQSVMRTTLMVGQLLTLERNQKRGASDVRIFEVGQRFLPSAQKDAVLPTERRMLTATLAGRNGGWLKPGAELDFFDVKGLVEELLDSLGHSAQFVQPQDETVSWLHPRIFARIEIGDLFVGVIGEVHSRVLKHFEIEGRAFAFEIDLDSIHVAPPAVSQDLPRFPAVTRDLSFFIDAEVSAQKIRQTFQTIVDPLCREVRVIEDYREAGKVPTGKKGMLWSFTYRAPDRTLTDAEVQAAHDKLVGKLKETLVVELR